MYEKMQQIKERMVVNNQKKKKEGIFLRKKYLIPVSAEEY